MERNGEGALRCFVAVSTRNPEDTLLAMKLAALQLWFGDEAGYLSTCQRLLHWAAGTDQPAVAERIGKIASLRQQLDPKLLEAALILARRCAQLGKDEAALPWFQMTQGMAEYRSGNYLAADQVLRMAEQAPPSTYQANTVKRTAGFYRAMIALRQGKVTEAQQFSDVAERGMKPVPPAEAYPFANGADHDDLILWLAFKETKALMEVSANIRSNP